jgi:Asp-tRNA(Asn)/Glu-tRNA(Gln) amidotransferase A subunit family amidase
MSNDQQLENLKRNVLIFTDELRDLILVLEMLVPIAEDTELLKKFSGTKQAFGVETIRGSFIQECIIGITKLTYDDKSQNPTAKTLIKGIATLPSDLLAELKDAFSVPIQAANWPVTEADAQILAEIEQKDAEKLRWDFDQYWLELKKEWAWFEEHRNTFLKLRDKRFAHVDVQLVDQQYHLNEIKWPEWNTIKDAVRRLVRIAEALLTILHRKDESFGQATKIAQRIAADFWQGR